jgi:hypothetical protein
MVKDPVLLAGAPEYLVSMPLEHLVSGAEQPRWCARNHLEIPGALVAIHSLFGERALQFLADYSSPESLTAAYESGDTRPLRQHHWYVFVAAAYIVQGRRADARTVLERHLGSPGLRKTYASAHAYAA